MADFCSFCYYSDINYNDIIKENIEKINNMIDDGTTPHINGGICEGCCCTSIKINKDRSIEIIDGLEKTIIGYIGNLNENNEIVVDETSDLFQTVYKKKKERYESETKTMVREFEAVKHIAYALYMIGDDPLIVSHHECVPFDEFKMEDHKEIQNKAWGIYLNLNKND